jgi:hypothetical protein
VESKDVVLLSRREVHGGDHAPQVRLSRQLVIEELLVLIHHDLKVLVNVLEPIVYSRVHHMAQVLLDVQLLLQVYLLVLHQVITGLLRIYVHNEVGL